MDGRTGGQTDGRTHGYQRETILSRHHRMAGYNNWNGYTEPFSTREITFVASDFFFKFFECMHCCQMSILLKPICCLHANKRQKDCLWKQRTHYRLENGSLGFIETLVKKLL